MEKLERAITRLQLVREGLQDNTIDTKDALDIVIEHLIELCQSLKENT